MANVKFSLSLLLHAWFRDLLQKKSEGRNMLANSIAWGDAAGCRPRMLRSVGLKTHMVPPGASNQQISQKFSKLPCTLPSATSGNMISQIKHSERSPLWCASVENDLLVHRYRTMHLKRYRRSSHFPDPEEAITFPHCLHFKHYVNYAESHLKIVISSLLLHKRSGEVISSANILKMLCGTDQAVLTKQ